MTWLAVKLFMGGVLKRVGALLSWAGRNPWQALSIALLCLCGALWWHYTGKVDDLTRTVATRDATISQMKDASEANRKAQLAQKAAVEQRYREHANETDLKHAQELGSARDALARYIALHRVRQAATGGGIGPSSPASESGSASSAVGPGQDAELAAVSADDLEICTVNSLRLKDARDWALGL